MDVAISVMSPSKAHKDKLKEILRKLEMKGLFIINMDKLSCHPDGIVIDFKKRKVFAVEVEVITRKNSVSKAKEKIISKYFTSKFIPLIIITSSEKEEEKIRY